MERAEMLVGLLERFPGYTLTTLLAEDVRLLGLVELADLARAESRV